ncbi:hypothetical protein J6590_077442 [Homalodisca vitripennis]|nr:hypothetical protein J6590_077442 [Homalodisca vitripennis]
MEPTEDISSGRSSEWARMCEREAAAAAQEVTAALRSSEGVLGCRSAAGGQVGPPTALQPFKHEECHKSLTHPRQDK